MNKTLVQMNMDNFPVELIQIINKAIWYDSSCSETAKTYFLEGIAGGRNAYLKVIKSGEAPNLKKDVRVLQWLSGKVPVAEVLYYSEHEAIEYLLTSEIEGEDAIHSCFKEKPEIMVEILGRSLRSLHSISIKDCTIDTYFEKRVKDFKLKLQSEKDFDWIWKDEVSCISQEELLKASVHIEFNAEDRVFTHGDYCLPNIVTKDNKLSGFIDLGNGGIGDRYYDIAWAFWSLNRNLGSTKWEKLFLESYGMVNIDYTKIKFYIALDQAP